MASIIRRTVFYDNTGGIARFWDWALCGTTLGTMAEPFSANNRHAVNTASIEFDPEDEIARIDYITQASSDRQQLLLSGGNEVIHGGTLMPKVGR